MNYIIDLLWNDRYPQVVLDGITGPIKFNDDGKRTGVELEILNLRNNFFKKVSS